VGIAGLNFVINSLHVLMHVDDLPTK